MRTHWRSRPLLVVFSLFACGGDGREGGALPADSADAPGVADGAGGTDAATAATCQPGAARPPLDEMRTLEHGGLTRTYHLHVPAAYDGTPTALVLDFHGYVSNALQQADFANMIEKSDTAGFVTVHAEGTNNPQRWNAGNCCPDASSTVDDVGFVMAMIDDVSSRVCIDEKRVYSTGLSNGGMLSYRLACEHGDRIAAIAPVAASLVYFDCEPTRGVPVLHFHGTEDPLNAYQNAYDSVIWWKQAIRCAGPPSPTFMAGDTSCQTWQGCDDGGEVTLCTVTGGGHTWPDGDVPSLLGVTTHAIDATDAMWDFFAAHALP